MEDRIQLIDQYCHYKDKPNKNVSRYIFWLNIFVIIIGVSLLLGGLTYLLAFVSTAFSWNRFEWKNYGGLATSLPICLLIMEEYARKRLLLLHRQQLKAQEKIAEIDWEGHNSTLEKWMYPLGTIHKPSLIWIFILVLFFMMIMGIWQQSSDYANPLWPYLKLPFGLFMVVLTFWFIYSYRGLKHHLSTVEQLLLIEPKS